MGVVRVEIPIDEEAAIGLADPNRLEAVGRLVSHMLRPTTEHNPLAALLDASGLAAEQAGLTQEDIDQELVASKAERAAWAGQQEERRRLTLDALADVDAGHLSDHQAVRAWADSLGTAKPLPPPLPR